MSEQTSGLNKTILLENVRHDIDGLSLMVCQLGVEIRAGLDPLRPYDLEP